MAKGIKVTTQASDKEVIAFKRLEDVPYEFIETLLNDFEYEVSEAKKKGKELGFKEFKKFWIKFKKDYKA